jgi:hypothetical protein
MAGPPQGKTAVFGSESVLLSLQSIRFMPALGFVCLNPKTTV